MTGVETILLVAGSLVLLGVIASKVSSRLGIPALLLFLGVGMLAGSDGVGGISFDDAEAARSLGTVALAYILFAGGLSSEWGQMRPVVRPALGLATVGVTVTAAITGAVAAVALDLPWMTGFLLGAILSSTDAAAVFSVLRSRSVSLRGRVRPLLELESGSNDPMAVLLTIGLIELITDPARPVASLLPMFVLQMGVGAVVGLALGTGAVVVVNRLHLDHDGLYPVLTMAAVVLTYAVAALAGGSGFLAVYLAGIVIGNSELLHKRSLVRFHDAIAWLAQIGMFLVLGLLVFPSRLPEVALPAIVVAIALVAVARPVAVLGTLALTRFSLRERLMVSWVGLRGAVPIILATFPLVADVPGAGTIFDVVFFAVIVSVLVQGTTIPLVARLLRVDAPVPRRPIYPVEAVSSGPGAQLHELVVGPDAPARHRSLLELGLPPSSLVVLVSRDTDVIVPQGSTQLEPEDRVLVLADADQLRTIRPVLEGPAADGQAGADDQ